MNDEELMAALMEDQGPDEEKKEKKPEDKKKPSGFVESFKAAAAPGLEQVEKGWDKLAKDPLGTIGRGVARTALAPIVGGPMGVNYAEDALMAVGVDPATLGLEGDTSTLGRAGEFAGKAGGGLMDLGLAVTEHKYGGKPLDGGGLAGGALGGTMGGVARGADPTRMGGMSREDPFEQATAMMDVMPLGTGAAKLAGGLSKRATGIPPTPGGAPLQPTRVDMLKGKAQGIVDEVGVEGWDAAQKFTPEELAQMKGRADLDVKGASDQLANLEELARMMGEPDTPKAAPRDIDAILDAEGALRIDDPWVDPGPSSSRAGIGPDLPPPPVGSQVSSVNMRVKPKPEGRRASLRPDKGIEFPEVPEAIGTEIAQIPDPITGLNKPPPVDLAQIPDPITGLNKPPPVDLPEPPTTAGAPEGPMLDAHNAKLFAEQWAEQVAKHQDVQARQGAAGFEGMSFADMQNELARLRALERVSPQPGRPPGFLDPMMEKGGEIFGALKEAAGATPRGAALLRAGEKAHQAFGPVGRPAAAGVAAGVTGGLPAGVAVGVGAGARELIKAYVTNPQRFESAMASIEALGALPPGLPTGPSAARAIAERAEQDPRILQILKQHGVIP